MAIQNPVNLNNQGAIQIPSGSGTSVGALNSVLQVGRILDVTIARSPDRQRGEQLGVYIQGKFYPAVLPDNVTSGDQLSVKVVSTTDALILKILG
ncbi:MAG: hypothetical protein KDD53_11570, partial [Bdellovibrionales bacterium]|nr:hypothetical protein [Bdellovibrionales bacterium]